MKKASKMLTVIVAGVLITTILLSAVLISFSVVSAAETVGETAAPDFTAMDPIDGTSSDMTEAYEQDASETPGEPTEAAKSIETVQPAAELTVPSAEPLKAPSEAPALSQNSVQEPTQAIIRKSNSDMAGTSAQAAGGLTLSAKSATIYRGNYYHLIANTRESVTFKSSDANIASVNDKGIVAAHNKGTVTITATAESGSAACKFKVITGSPVKLSIKNIKIYSQMTYHLVSNTSAVKWTSSDPSVASVSGSKKNGVVKGERAGVAVITATGTDGGAASCLVTVLPAETLKINAKSATVYLGNYYHIVATSNTNVTFKSSNSAVASVNENGVVTARKSGTVTVTANTNTKSAACKIKIVKGSAVNLSHKKATVNRFMTYMVRSTTSGVKWTSSDPSVATVTSKSGYGFIQGKKSGTAVITAYTSKGAATCLVTVKPARAVRFAYAAPNCAAKKQKVTLTCITDTQRTAVRFAVQIGKKTKYVNATSSVKDGDTLVWKGTISFDAAGTYQVKAYAQYNNKTVWSSCTDGETTVFVANSTNETTTVCTKRRASDKLIKLIATFEGYFASTYIDSFTGDPTLGYGVLVFPGETFYNQLTKKEAYAELVHNINNVGYADDVNQFLVDNKVKFNQQQFDALVCFVYNCGTGTLYDDDELIDALLDCSKKGVRDLNYIKKQNFINKLCQYHHAGGGCVYGLLYRRVDETEMFFYDDYQADYGDYRYKIKFTCARNSKFHT